MSEDSLPDEWLHPTPLPFIPPRIKQRHHTCGSCKYDGVPEKDVPCRDCIYSIDMRKDLWQPKGGKTMLGEYKDYVYIKDTLTNLLDAGYNIPMIETVLEQIKAEAASEIVKSYKEKED